MQGKDDFLRVLGEHRDRRILLYGDPDVDGLFSLKLLADFAEMIGVSFTWHVNENRSHGFELPVSALKGYLVLAADFAITAGEMKTLVQNDVAVLSIDHHSCGDTYIHEVCGDVEGIVINNQYPFEPDEDRYLSGCGVVYEFFCDIMPEFKSETRAALVGVTLLSDGRQIENKKAHRYLAKAFTNADDYVKYLVNETMQNDFGFGVPRMDRDFIDFQFSPAINAMLRYNKGREAVNFIFGGGMPSGVDYRELQKALVSRIREAAEVLEMSSMVAIAVNAELFDEDVSNFIGLVCSKYQEAYGKSALIFAYMGDRVVRASFRGKCDEVSYLDEFIGMGLDAAGHEPAFGIRSFKPNASLWGRLNALVERLEKGYQDTRKIIETSNLSVTIMNVGSQIAYDNCFVRDQYRTYIRYKGGNVKEIRHTYRMIEAENGVKPDKVVSGVGYTYERTSTGEKITKYVEALIDGQRVKAFQDIHGGMLILPILEKGYLQLYLV